MIKFSFLGALIFFLGLLVYGNMGSLSTHLTINKCHKFDTTDFCKVYRIDSIKDFYIIYVIKDRLRYKVVSKKLNRVCNPPIMVGNKYQFKLTYVIGMVAVGVFKPTCVEVATKTKVCLENSIKDMCYAKNLKGLCLTFEE